jgi:hypothetical protein
MGWFADILLLRVTMQESGRWAFNSRSVSRSLLRARNHFTHCGDGGQRRERRDLKQPDVAEAGYDHASAKG